VKERRNFRRSFFVRAGRRLFDVKVIFYRPDKGKLLGKRAVRLL